MKFSVIVPVYNTAKHLHRCLEGLHALDYPVEEYEILMVDNNSTDESARILAADKGIRVLKEAKQGSYAARNRAIREAKGSILAFLDSDCIPDPGWLRSIEKAFADPDAHILLGLRKPANKNLTSALLSAYEAKKDELVFNSRSPELYYGFTNNMAVRKSTFDTYGPFVERPRGSDTIFVRRVVDGEGCSVAGTERRALIQARGPLKACSQTRQLTMLPRVMIPLRLLRYVYRGKQPPFRRIRLGYRTWRIRDPRLS